MKTLLITMTLAQSLIGISYAAENIKWAQGPFWKAPQSVEFSRKVQIVDQDLLNACAIYNKFTSAYKNDEPSNAVARSVDLLRKKGLSRQMSFKGRFEVLDVPADLMIENEMSVDTSNEVEALPMFNQSNSFTGIMLSKVEGFEVVLEEDSLTALSRKLELDDSVAIFTNRQGKLMVEVNGTDLACDLISKKATLKAIVPSYVRITPEASLEMSSFYNSKIAPQVADILSKNESATEKAVRLGYRLGKVLEEKTNGSSQLVEKQIGNLMGLLFVPKTLNPSALVLNYKAIDFTSSVNAGPATLTLGM